MCGSLFAFHGVSLKTGSGKLFFSFISDLLALVGCQHLPHLSRFHLFIKLMKSKTRKTRNEHCDSDVIRKHRYGAEICVPAFFILLRNKEIYFQDNPNFRRIPMAV